MDFKWHFFQTLARELPPRSRQFKRHDPWMANVFNNRFSVIDVGGAPKPYLSYNTRARLDGTINSGGRTGESRRQLKKQTASPCDVESTVLASAPAWNCFAGFVRWHDRQQRQSRISS